MGSNRDNFIHIDTAQQTLALVVRNDTVFETTISSGANGVGEQLGSEKTPRGAHVIRAKIGSFAPENAVFVGRRWTGEIYTPALGNANPGRDWILTRILWLSGCEPGKNRFELVDTFKRYIYIHGTPDSVTLGKPGSRGCIRMNNAELIKLYEMVPVGTQVLISD